MQHQEAAGLTDSSEIPAQNTAPYPLFLYAGTTLAEARDRMVKAAMQHFNGNKPQAAKSLGISLKTLYNHLKRVA